MQRPQQTKSPMARAGLTEQAAAEFVWRHGPGALAILVERAETAEELGHRVAATSWRDLADVAARLLQVSGADSDSAVPLLPLLAAGVPLARRHRSGTRSSG